MSNFLFFYFIFFFFGGGGGGGGRCAIEEVAVRPNMMADFPILHFRNSWHNSFLEKYSLHCFTAFCACSSSKSLDMCIK